MLMSSNEAERPSAAGTMQTKAAGIPQEGRKAKSEII